jgi:hypothetical protein
MLYVSFFLNCVEAEGVPFTFQAVFLMLTNPPRKARRSAHIVRYVLFIKNVYSAVAPNKTSEFLPKYAKHRAGQLLGVGSYKSSCSTSFVLSVPFCLYASAFTAELPWLEIPKYITTLQ